MSCPRCRGMTDERLAAKVKEWAKDPVVKAAIDAENAKYPGITHAVDSKPITISAPQEGVYGPELHPAGCPSDPSRFDPPTGCQGDPDPAAGLAAAVDKMIMDDVRYALVGNPDRVNAPEPLGEPANIRTELAQLRADLTAVCKFIHDADEPSVIHTMGALASALKRAHEYVRALDSHQKQVDARLDEIEKHTDFSHNSK